MTEYFPPKLDALRDAVVVITGGSLGMGAALTRLCHESGAHVFFGDVELPKGEALAKALNSTGRTTTNKAVFVPFDATSYADNVKLFDVAYQAFGRVDHAVAAAGVIESGDLTDPTLTIETVKEEPKRTLAVLDVNLVGPLYFSRVASVYLRQGEAGRDKSLTFISSIAGISEAVGLPVYAASKHGVIGLMRCLRRTLGEKADVRIRTNAILPWMTKTRMVAGVEDFWGKAGLPTNEAEDVAKHLAGVMSDATSNGMSFFIGGGRAFETEQGLDRTRPQWFGEMTDVWLKGQVLLDRGFDWHANSGSS